jgi:hypothetical protein
MFDVVQRVRDWYYVPDDERHVERVRKMVTNHERHRRFFAGLHGLLLLVWVGLAVAMTIMMGWISDFLSAGTYWGPAGFLLGIILGIPYGFGFVQNVHGLLVGERNEQLMLRYHDALAMSLRMDPGRGDHR